VLGWIVRILFVAAAPIAGLLVARDSLNFGVMQGFVAIILIVACCRVDAAAPAFLSGLIQIKGQVGVSRQEFILTVGGTICPPMP